MSTLVRLRRTLLRGWLAAFTVAVLGIATALAAQAAPDSSTWACSGTRETRQPVLLVHGYNSGPSTWGTSALETLAGAGSATCLKVLDYSNVSTNWVTDPAIGPELAKTMVGLGTAFERGGGSGKVIVVAHSMGGLALRCAISTNCGGEQADAARAHLRAVVTYGTPNTGTWLREEHAPTLGAGILGSILSAGCHGTGDLLGTGQKPCALVRAYTTSAATKAFTPNSQQLKDLWRINPKEQHSDIPVLAMAYRTDIDTSLFGHVVAHVGNAGDMVVFEDSAQAESNKSSDGVGGDFTKQCPSIDISFSKLLILRHAFECWHGGEPNDPELLSRTADMISHVEAIDATNYVEPPATSGLISFTTPSRNIGCYISTLADQSDPANEARCDINEFDYQLPPRPDGCDGDIGVGGAFGQAITLGATGPAALLCYGDTALNDQVVPYGTTVTAGVFSCTVAETGVTCRNSSTGHGFALSKRAYALQ